jgi:hypothetical protein
MLTEVTTGNSQELLIRASAINAVTTFLQSISVQPFNELAIPSPKEGIANNEGIYLAR